MINEINSLCSYFYSYGHVTNFLDGLQLKIMFWEKGYHKIDPQTTSFEETSKYFQKFNDSHDPIASEVRALFGDKINPNMHKYKNQDPKEIPWKSPNDRIQQL